MSNLIQEEIFLFNSIRMYNKFSLQAHKDTVLHAVGVRFNLLEKRPFSKLTQEERNRVLDHLRDFCKEHGIEILLKPASNSPAN